MFYDKFIKLCNEKKKAPTVVAQEIGLNKSAKTAWKNGSVPKDTTISKLCEYFGVSRDFFEEENKKSAPIIESGLNRKTIFAEMLYRLPDRDRLVIEHNIQMLYRLAQAEGKLKHNGLCVDIDLVMMELEKGRDRLLGGRED